MHAFLYPDKDLMTTTNTTEKSLKKFPFSEAELLENIDEDNAHSDEVAVLIEREFSN